MSDILEKLKTGVSLPGSHAVSLKLEARHMAMIDAVSKLRGSNNKSDAIRFLMDLGWEAIESDGDFAEIIYHKEQAEEYYSEPQFTARGSNFDDF